MDELPRCRAALREALRGRERRLSDELLRFYWLSVGITLGVGVLLALVTVLCLWVVVTSVLGAL